MGLARMSRREGALPQFSITSEFAAFKSPFYARNRGHYSDTGTNLAVKVIRNNKLRQMNKEGELDYIESMSPWAMWLRVPILRGVANAFATYSNWNALRPSRAIWLNSTLGAKTQRQAIKVDVYEPLNQGHCTYRRPAIINFHGGGVTVGRGTDDATWASHLVTNMGATVFSIYAQADVLGIDSNHLAISGFSAGGGLGLAAWALLNNAEEWGYKIPLPIPKITGLALFYPSLDQTVPKARKREGLPRQDLLLPKGLTDIFDAAYLKPVPISERGDIRLSPSRMPDDLLERLPPVYLCLCEHDILAAEGVAFSKRLEDHSIEIYVRIIPGARHGWDNAPTPADTVAKAYNEASKLIKDWLE
ncbi:lipase [Fusarium phyllophilum]|uniref:Lipase n=1 Tax=Fusarium phyllophilum TaxID=47803 RepID=A0A8H5N8A9_9HYPO|nr:lipase [Fusarium phyllophilum]